MRIKQIFITTLILGLLVTGAFVSNALKQSAVSSDGGLVGYWSLNADSLYDTDIFQDLSGNGNNGTSANTPVYASDQAGTPNQAMTFNGSSDYVTIADNDSLDLITGLTISLWMYTDNNNQDNAKLVSKYWGTSYGLQIENTNQFLLGAKIGGVAQEKTSTGTWATSQWNHLVGVTDGQTYQFFINGIDAGSGSWSTQGNIAVDAQILHIGCSKDINAFFTGSISDAMLFSSALTVR